jgi:hypothetical protein
MNDEVKRVALYYAIVSLQILELQLERKLRAPLAVGTGGRRQCWTGLLAFLFGRHGRHSHSAIADRLAL